jgi:hypothetical protein
MSSQIFEIRSWNALIRPESKPMPMVYVIPTPELLNKHFVEVEIKNTNTGYDNLRINAMISPSSLTAGYRPNFQEQTGYASIILMVPWNSYPMNNGQLIVYGLDPAQNPQSVSNVITTENFTIKETDNIVTIIIISVIVMIIVGAFLVYK